MTETSGNLAAIIREAHEREARDRATLEAALVVLAATEERSSGTGTRAGNARAAACRRACSAIVAVLEG